jgi:cytochrome c
MLRTVFVLAGLGIATGGFASFAHADGDPEAGKKTFAKCKACHVLDKEQNRVGPHLVDIFGRAAGAVDGFKYSDAMLNSGITWDEATMDAYIADPKGYIPKNKMAFPGLKDEEDRANVIAYIKQETGG